MTITDKGYYVFFTAKDLKSDQGGIALAESGDAVKWKFRRTVIREPFVQSHPFVFEWRNEYYLIPEAPHGNVGAAIQGDGVSGRVEVRGKSPGGRPIQKPDAGALQGAVVAVHVGPLERHPAPVLGFRFTGTWKEHSLSPIVKEDLRSARPAGRPFVLDGALHRLAQDCHPTYGRGVRAFRITDLSATAYAEKAVETPVVAASGDGWNSEGMHHVDAQRTAAGQWIAAVDALGVQ